ncbi:hypothetical protein [uncultured Faecalibaculum sp.]|uniref:hypothetical protein n=2 Tax=uncultured Faecalibaculum sp. TaxID=1729681 RepID=UPI00261F2738|nr:hypothetical protein [uncultured Faecalibaculum sp.]
MGLHAWKKLSGNTAGQAGILTKLWRTGMNLSLDQRQLCDIQGRLFENSTKAGLDSPAFIKSFMTSSVAVHLDDEYDRLQWMGEEYLDRLPCFGSGHGG